VHLKNVILTLNATNITRLCRFIHLNADSLISCGKCQ
jgi:hypothetical protein